LVSYSEEMLTLLNFSEDKSGLILSCVEVQQ
jgi:hypothetical protein